MVLTRTPQWSIGVHRPDRRSFVSFDSRVGVAAGCEKRGNGNVACELSPQLYGAAVWWVLLEKV